MMNFIWVIPLLPLVGALLNGVVLRNRASKPLVTAVALGSVLLSLLVGMAAIADYLATGGFAAHQGFEKTLYIWVPASVSPLVDGGFANFQVEMGFLLDPLSSVLLFVVTFVGFLIHVYSVGYMRGEVGYQRYFVYLNLFMGAMLLLILGNNFLVMFVGWEGVGLCSYLLIGFYYDQEFPPYAGRKAFIVNRIGDFAFLVGMFALVAKFGTLQYSAIFPVMAQNPSLVEGEYLLGMSFASFVALCFFIGAMGKSAQIPLYVWLPDAMAGPTPVSALIHAATMVTAGVYMLARSNVLFQLAPEISAFVAIVGATTALFAATIGLAQTDIKKVLAYSTVSQLGYMFLAAGVGAYSVAVFHLMTHAFFKGLLFLGSGSVIHAMGGEQDMRRMGGLKQHLPVTYWTFLVGTLAIAGVPGLAGFFSKDQILASAFGGGHILLWVVGLLTAGLTACYMFRLLLMTFHGEFRGSDAQYQHLHESPAVMTWPLRILALGAILIGYVGLPRLGSWDKNWFGHFLEPVLSSIGQHGAEHHAGVGEELVLMALSVAVAGAGIFCAWSLYGGTKALAAGARCAARFPVLHRVLLNKYYVDEFYDSMIINPLSRSAKICWKWIDSRLIEGLVHAGPVMARLVGDFGRLTTTGNVRSYSFYFLVGVLLLVCWAMF